MADLTTVTDFPPWSIDYDFDVINPTHRTLERGYKRQTRHSKRELVRATATRKLTGIELPFFEWFVRDEIDDGHREFTDRYKDGNGVQTGTMFIVDGSYTVETNGKNHTVKCELEIRR